MSQKRELEKLTGLDNLFGDEEEQSLSDSTLPLSQIILPPSQPRRYFDPVKLKSLANSIKEVGLLEPIAVRKIEEDKYELIAGERRLKACEIAGLEEISVVILECDEKKARKLRLVENLQREDLNAYEETIGILELLAEELDLDQEAVVSLLYQMNNETKGNSNHNVMVSEEALAIQTIFLQIGKISWESFVSNRLPLLKLPQDIQITLEKGQIEYTKAQVIARIKDNKKRQNILKKAIEENLSLSAIKELVGDILPIQSENKPQSPQQQNKERASKIYKSLLKSKIWDDEKKVKKVNRLFDQIEALLEEKKEDAS
ncbi:ParB/RepB/Spo0J family partition protein (plasmid) [Anabaena sp. FACHB-709]|uniref:Chromosome partitioning protein, ParB family n=2 Tax=Nostocaceae TaxID=1162 RepID=A0A1Z4KW33_ANAVA|nr:MULTISPECIES: ParB/RepB/Spo0J family partition protein [Nostocaceae]BAY73137.1 chromosome partitioning protein, ParB family [Trichormus variabilis NIES-23]HBW31189.1 ParB/RepB/Spo0J family partition protein [Nostoc sp. UBA8866]MBD2172930.1 ParB/RepB/Spo0J family partition protein [Anabaena cylindrica FACHB-318]MBD2264672.1 ParB/RepB/Spo0J family partition protein [Anabaena sp. FACHB-709]MBD2273979.1 ParB/RepB/Spo0J family partition protein [Nostoc sp. PCC 7120 = FACHB-418]